MSWIFLFHPELSGILLHVGKDNSDKLGDLVHAGECTKIAVLDLPLVSVDVVHLQQEILKKLSYSAGIARGFCTRNSDLLLFRARLWWSTGDA